MSRQKSNDAKIRAGQARAEALFRSVISELHMNNLFLYRTHYSKRCAFAVSSKLYTTADDPPYSLMNASELRVYLNSREILWPIYNIDTNIEYCNLEELRKELLIIKLSGLT